MEREIGELFEVDGVKLKCVVKHDDCCLNCYFCDKGLQCMQQNCSSSNRKDSINVMFIQIKEQKIKILINIYILYNIIGIEKIVN